MDDNMAKYDKTDMETRKRTILEHLNTRRGGRSLQDITNALSIGSESTVKKALDDLWTSGRVNRTKSSRNSYGGFSYLYHITPVGVASLMVPEEPEDAPRGDWSSRPSLMPEESPAPVEDAPVAETPTPAPAAPEAPTPDVDALSRVLETIRSLHVDDADIDFELASLERKVEAKVEGVVAPCPCCGSRMKVQSVGDNRALLCTGCCLAVTYKKDPRDFKELVRRWARRTPQ